MRLRSKVIYFLNIFSTILILPLVIAAENQKCHVTNVGTGVCVNEDKCKLDGKQTGNAKAYPKICKHDSEKIKCCIKDVDTLTDGTILPTTGKCKNINEGNCSEESYTRYLNQCPGDDVVQLCVPNTNLNNNTDIDDVNLNLNDNCPEVTVSQMLPMLDLSYTIAEVTIKFIEAYKNSRPSTYDYISDLAMAIGHYRGKSGKTVPASNTLINEEMKKSLKYKNMKKELKKIIKDKVTDEKIKNETVIRNAKNSGRGLWCLTLGSYYVNIDYAFYPKSGWNTVKIHFSGYDTWDFEHIKKEKDQNFLKNFWNGIKTGIHNILDEDIPSFIAGDGKTYDITYDFYDEVTFFYGYSPSEYFNFGKRSVDASSEICNFYTFKYIDTYDYIDEDDKDENDSSLNNNDDSNGTVNFKYISLANVFIILTLVMFWQINIVY
ncbi:hypothetical protein BCR36DRAFT_371635 [Piromyces finnis]|uniref:Uncharacterized protein n=1 Tax=Piromyces finnis TaxID=1754191 RepID=A0A1Y1V561_9FUNG|nr:hypothetical protein BCR36DRAFT_371635 [Piromyces finnis]|eukprot:ORX47572.1 hypothetical protein BCR36DRAFT_371635 [Piromyces finnis]